MRILQIIDSLHPGGAERMAVNIANGLVNKVTLSALCCGREEGLLKEQLDPKVNYLFANRKGKLGISGVFRTLKFIKRNQITHIHAHSTSIYTAWFFKLRNPKLKLIWHYHLGNTEILVPEIVKLLTFVSKKVNSTIVVNQSLLVWARAKHLGQNIYFLPNFASIYKQSKQHLHIPGSRLRRVVCLANLRPEKDQLLLIEVWKKIKIQFPDWDLLLVGKCFKDVYEAQIKTAIADNKLSKSIHLLGSRTDTATILEQSTIGVLSSQSEGLPLALLEYGLAGLPVVITDAGACKEIVGNYGIVVPSNSPTDLKEALIKLMENPELRTQFGTGLRERVNSHYSEKSYMDKLLSIYQA
jgi:glycosyltransferase involved in cell wall biosynthesis